MVLHSIDYCPSINFFSNIKNEVKILLDFNQPFNKQQHNNRCSITSSQGLLSLSIPLLGGRNQKNIFSKIEIDYTQKWQQHHWKTINSCYGKSPFFIYYKDNYKDILFTKHQFLKDLNLQLLQWCLQKIKINCTIELVTIQPLQNIFLKPTHFIGALNQKKYRQVFNDRNGFFFNCSILDLLFNEGKNSVNYI